MANDRARGAILGAIAIGALAGCSVLADWSNLTSGGTGGGAGHAGGAGGGGGAGQGGANTGGGGNGGCTGKKGAKEVAVGGFCIDATETSNVEYKAFLDDKGATAQVADQPPACAWNLSYNPGNASGTWSYPASDANQPVGDVDWCDAHAHCAWAGKRLCGKIGGGSNAPGDYKDEARSQWYRACSNGDPTRLYPYGKSYEAGRCYGDRTSGPLLIDVGSDKSCEGGVAGLFDMSGNVDEWEDSCDGETGNVDNCLVRGGGSDDGAFSLTCAQPTLDKAKKLSRDTQTPLKGIRCCSD